MSTEEIHELCYIDRWFLLQLREFLDVEGFLSITKLLEWKDDGKNAQWDIESVQRGNAGEGYGLDDSAAVQVILMKISNSPLLSRHTSGRWDQAALSCADSVKNYV